MNRGDQREVIFRDDEDRQKFLSMLASGLSNSASKGLAADGDGLGMPEPNTDRGAKAEKLKCGDAEIGMGGEHGLGFSFSAFQRFSISACVFKTGSRIRP